MIKFLDPDLAKFFQHPFVDISNLKGEIYRVQPGRKTLAFKHHDKNYFVKIHTGAGFQEIIKNILQLRAPIISAEPEWNALVKLKELGIKAPIPVAFGKQGFNPARIKSFIITKALIATINLEEFLKTQNALEFIFKKYLIESVATIAKTLHENGINHRDFYLCHFLLDQSNLNFRNPSIYLIDLHRAHIRRKVPLRWQIKDISGLYFSTLNFNFTQRDYFRFMVTYTAKSLRCILKEDSDFWSKVQQKAFKLYKKLHK